MKIASKTDIGRVRSTNQDSFAAGELGKTTAWAVVCDGMGGANGGNIASANAVTIISEYISASYHEGMASNSIRTLLQSALFGANVRLYEMARNIESLSGMGTTVVAVIINNNVAHIAHAGDSRAYIIHSGHLRQVTRDHSIIQSMVDKGQITAEEAKNHPNKNVITRALGVGEDVDIEYNEIPFESDDCLLICTDGLTNFVTHQDIEKIVTTSPFEEYPDILVNIANENGGGDNITVIALEN